MSADPLKSIGWWVGREVAFEGVIPITIAGYAFWKLRSLVSQAAMTRPLSDLEIWVMVGGLVALVAWAVSRQIFMFGRRKPVTISFFATLVAVGAAYGLAYSAASGFASECGMIEGKLKEAYYFLDNTPQTVCIIGGIQGNGYVPGSMVRPNWAGTIDFPMLCYLIFVSITASLALRDRRIAPTRIVLRLYRMLQYAPASGLDGVLGEKASDGKVQACSNATFWGEICGQLYSAKKKFEPGEWCGRCNQTYVKAERELTFNIVTLFTDNIDLLNQLEKQDTLSWDATEPPPPDSRQSGVERWVVLGQITVPDVISVSQLLSIAHSQIGSMPGKDERAQAAVELAKARASKLYGWIWFGRQSKKLTFARPTNKVLMAIGTTRLRDLITDSGEELYLQLDIGLLPLELRTAFFKTFLDLARPPRFQNSKYDVWVPVAPKLNATLAGLWVPRIEGEALQKWLSTGRLEKEGKLGVSVPRPYQPAPERETAVEYDPAVFGVPDAEAEEIDEEEELELTLPQEEDELELDDIFDQDDSEEEIPTAEETIEEDIPEPPPPPTEIIHRDEKNPTITVKPGTLDIVLAPFKTNTAQPEPDLESVVVGSSISEWSWFEPEQIQRLRQQSLVLVDGTKLKKRNL